MTKQYRIKISGKEATEFNNENGEMSEHRIGFDFNLSRTLFTENLTRQKVLDEVKEMLYLTRAYRTEDLFDGNESYFILRVTENGEGYEANDRELEHNKVLYDSEYFIWVEEVKSLDAVSIQ